MNDLCSECGHVAQMHRAGVGACLTTDPDARQCPCIAFREHDVCDDCGHLEVEHTEGECRAADTCECKTVANLGTYLIGAAADKRAGMTLDELSSWVAANRLLFPGDTPVKIVAGWRSQIQRIEVRR